MYMYTLKAYGRNYIMSINQDQGLNNWEIWSQTVNKQKMDKQR